MPRGRVRGEFVRINGTVVHIRHSNKKSFACEVKGCIEPASRECDWKLQPGVTCDFRLCDKHTSEPAPGKDLCPWHAKMWAERKANGPDAGNT